MTASVTLYLYFQICHKTFRFLARKAARDNAASQDYPGNNTASTTIIIIF